jgi:putative heme-binding domain-containing protein
MRYLLVLTALAISTSAFAQQHIWGKFGTPRPRPTVPVLFLDKPAAVVDFQLKRLDNQRLLMVHRRDNDPKFVPVFREILSRPGIASADQKAALEALVTLQKANRVDVLLEAISLMPQDSDASTRSLTQMLVSSPVDELKSQVERMKQSAQGKNSAVTRAAFAGLIAAGKADVALKLCPDAAGLITLMDSITMIPGKNELLAMKPTVLEAIRQKNNLDLRAAGARAIETIPMDATEKFEAVAPLVNDDRTRTPAVKTLMSIDQSKRGQNTAMTVLKSLVEHAERTPKAQRTSDEFLMAMSLADQLIARAPKDDAKSYRDRLDAITVRLIRIATVQEEMRYDIPYFVVAAGKPVQIVLINHDTMPHNLVIGTPGSLKQIVADGLAAGPNGGWNNLPYVGKSPQLLQATKMVPSNEQDRITFDAPKEVGEYPYVCTFPQHWYRMYGVMVVVDDLDAFLKNPVPPANPIGSQRSFVANWSVDDLKDELAEGLKGRSNEIGAKIFNEASCAGCHVMQGVGGKIGPELTDVYTRWKGDDVGVLREILEPSHKIDPKYVMQNVVTVDGVTITGILVSEDEDVIRLLRSAEDKEPFEILQDDIDVIVPSKDEIFELMAYLKSGGK